MDKNTEITIKVTIDEEKLETLQLYRPADAKPLDTLLQETASQTLDKLFGKHVPLAVQNFLDRKNGLPQREDRPRPPRRYERRSRSQNDGQPTAPDEPVQTVTVEPTME